MKAEVKQFKGTFSEKCVGSLWLAYGRYAYLIKCSTLTRTGECPCNQIGVSPPQKECQASIHGIPGKILSTNRYASNWVDKTHLYSKELLSQLVIKFLFTKGG